MFTIEDKIRIRQEQKDERKSINRFKFTGLAIAATYIISIIIYYGLHIKG